MPLPKMKPEKIIKPMSKFDGSQLDGHLLQLLLAVLETGSITAAAERLGVTQSAVSHLLDKLRAITGDPLFVKRGRGIVPTARAEALAADVAAAFPLQDVLARSAASAQRAADFIGAGAAADGYAALRPADVYMLSVGDDQIVPACAALAAAVPLKGAIVFHCSGALASDRLQAARDAGAYVARAQPR
eukprot:gene23529-29753_t